MFAICWSSRPPKAPIATTDSRGAASPLPLAQPRQALLEVVAVLLGLPRDRHAARA